MATDYKRGEYVDQYDNRNLTVRQAMNDYINNRENVIEPTTVRNYRYIAKYRFDSIADIKLTALRTTDVQRAVNYESNIISAKYVKNSYAFLKSVLVMYGVNLNYQSIKIPKQIKNNKPKELPSFNQIFSIVKGTECELPVLLAAWLSLRIGEVTGLKYKDIDNKNNLIHIRRTIIYTEQGIEIRESCKTEQSTRDLQLPKYILDLINKQPHNSQDDFIITKSRRAVTGKFTRLMNKHGIQITFHDLRHLNASIMLMLNIPDKYAMERGGWSTDHILKSVYQQAFSNERLKVDNIIDEYFNNIILDNSSEK